jgi:hypothetical protein
VITHLEVKGLASVPSPNEIDWALFRNLNFDPLEKNGRSKRREKSKEVQKKGPRFLSKEEPMWRCDVVAAARFRECQIDFWHSLFLCSGNLAQSSP